MNDIYDDRSFVFNLHLPVIVQPKTYKKEKERERGHKLGWKLRSSKNENDERFMASQGFLQQLWGMRDSLSYEGCEGSERRESRVPGGRNINAIVLRIVLN